MCKYLFLWLILLLTTTIFAKATVIWSLESSSSIPSGISYELLPDNPVPIISDIYPNSACAGGAAFTLVVNGSNFVSSSVVQFNGSNRTTTFVNSGQLTAKIVADNITTAGSFPITVFNPTPGGGTSSGSTFTVNPLPTVAAITPGGTTNVCIGSTWQLSDVTSGGVWSSANNAIASVNSSGLVTGVTTGNVLISYTVTDINGCSKAANKTVNVFDAPYAAGAIAGPATFVQGTSGIAYSVDAIPNATSYVWSYSGSGVTINGTGASVTLYFAVNAIDGELAVKGHSYCGDGVSSSLALSGYKTLNLTSVLLEGLYNSGGLMRQAQNATGPQWPSDVADHISVVFHDASNYSSIIYESPPIELSTTGTATVNIPSIYNGTYYITIKHRNSIETTTATAISFAGSMIAQSFGAQAFVYGGNLKANGSFFLIYGGNAHQDDLVDGSDMNEVDNGSTAILVGYNAADVNGDGLVDGSDMNIVDNNSTPKVQVKKP
ncbi:MAG: Ig-like domain-containing protein [Bacteroidota bacterium]|nr:Ig-like domain-containing protein [Bacteroidota bacterium]